MGNSSEGVQVLYSATEFFLAVQGDLEKLLGPCDAPRVGPSPIHSIPQVIKYGHFHNASLTACQNAHSETFAQILTSLAAGNLSWVRYQGVVLNSTSELVAALIESGHQIELRQERTYANFLSFTLEDQIDMRWPLWIDTGLEVDHKPLIIPSGHSQHSWRISGPLVNTRISFFIGMYGAAFHNQTDNRPAWTGGRVAFDTTTDRGPEAKAIILKTFRAAEQYLQLNRKERNTVAKGLPSDGYGYLGICNDSDCFLEAASRGTFSGYPLVRNSDLNKAFPDGDIAGDLLKKISNDSDFHLANRKDILRRIYEMRPYPLDSDLWFNETVLSQMKSIQAELGLH